MAEYLPKFKPGQAITLTASVTITGGQLVIVTGDGTVGPATAASPAVVGVAAFDTASGSRVTVYAGGVQRIVASGAITAGARVDAAAAGKVASAANGITNIGLALSTAADGALCDVQFDR